LAEGLQRRRIKCEKLTDDRRRTPSDGKSSHCLWQGELKIICCKFEYIYMYLPFLCYSLHEIPVYKSTVDANM
jgi:hypothetical protein